jgi:Transposase DDE domain
MDAKTGQVCAALMTHQDVDDASALRDLLDQIPYDMPIEIIGGDGAYDTKRCHATIAAHGALPSIPPREGAMPWPESTPGAGWRNEAIDAIAQSGRPEWKKCSGYHRRSLVENLMYRLKTLTGNCLWARRIGSQATEVAIRVGVLNHMTALARPQSVRIA